MFSLCIGVVQHAKIRYLLSLPSDNLVYREKISAFRPLWVVELHTVIYEFNEMSFHNNERRGREGGEERKRETLGMSQFCSA
jgi:hypothetical protein